MDYSKLLEVYTLTEILEYNDMSEDEVLQLLIDQRIILELPSPRPLDFND